MGFKGGAPTTKLSAEELVARGYRCVSRAYGLVARVDRSDWLEVLAKEMMRAPADFLVLSGPDKGRPSGLWADYYRRCHSKDMHTVPEHVCRQVPTSCHDPIGFVEAFVLQVTP